MKRITNLVALLMLTGWMLMSGLGCSPFSKPLLFDTLTSEAVPPKTDVYGAYYEYDELFVEASYMDMSYVQTPVNKFVINKKIKIVSKDGTQYGSVPVRWYGYLEKFRISMTDSNGLNVDFDQYAIRETFNEKGIIVFPKVTVGSTLTMYVEFKSWTPLTAFEYFFETNLPAKTKRFTFSYLNKYAFAYKNYAQAPSAVESTAPTKRHHYISWTSNNITPQENLIYQQSSDWAIPRVSLVMTKYLYQSVYKDWQELTKNYEDYILKQTFFNSSKKMRGVVDSVAPANLPAFERVARLQRWVQENISYVETPLAKINPDAVISSRKGNLWEMAVIMKEMCDYLKLPTDMLVTRSKELGGFDQNFVTPLVLSVPFSTVKIDSSEYLLYPYRRGGKVGEYPRVFFDLFGLSLNRGAPKKLPRAVSANSATSTVCTISPDSVTGEYLYTLEIRYDGYAGYSLRSLLLDYTSDDIRETYQKMLTIRGASNELLDCVIENLDDPYKPLRVKCTFRSPGQLVGRKNQQQLRLSHLFSTEFDLYDTMRVDIFSSQSEISLNDTVVFRKNPGQKIEPVLELYNLNNALFESKCTVSENDQEWIFQRNLKIKSGELYQPQMRKIYPDIVTLNTIENTSLLLK